ncbi:hypothetical protein GZH47_18335 [Paenibacillus rhizovicinus]|uniref:Uncharacterized protein n=1 Tax=Paenibacillus rhizovicinus TaxID=2704463 RepID=A0A6C0P258_9BACL|nr:hypothetical protein [Paenibacillus rhizovicinus]QHW32578.1 hypothetical protein GZH47_18335 [Paenibacillus rhizovicinus]
MAQKWVKLGVVALASSALLFQNVDFSVSPVSAAASTTTNSISSKIVKLNASAYLSIRDVHLTMQNQGKVLVYSVSITNNGNTSLDLIDYWLRVKTKSGKSFKTTVIDADKDIKDIPAKSTQYLTYYTTVDSQTKLTDLTFQVVKWDFSAADYERVLGNIAYPANGTDRIAPYKAAVMLYDNNKIRSAIKQSYITTDATNAYLVVNLLVENVGFQSSDLSKMNFFVQTDSFSKYNVTASGMDQMTIQPNERKIVTLRATIPLAVAGKPLSLLVAQNDEASKLQLPLGLYSLPAMKPLAAAAAGKTQMVYMAGTPVNTTAGRVFVSQETSSKDISMEFKLKNISSASIANPALDYFIVTASGTSYPLSYMKEDNATLLPNIEKTVTLTGQVPSNVNLTNAKLVVKSQATEKESAYIIGKYMVPSPVAAAAVGKSQLVYMTNSPINTMADKVFVSQGTSSKDVSMEFKMTNIGTVAVDNPALDYNIVTASGTSYPMSYEKVDNAKLLPNIETSVTLTGQIPKNVSLTNARLVVRSQASDKANAYIIGMYTIQNPVDAEAAGVGKSQSVTLSNTPVNTLAGQIYVSQGTSSKDVSVEFKMTNNGTVAIADPALDYFLVTASGTNYPLSYTKDDNGKLLPKIEKTFALSGQIPSTVNLTNAKLVVKTQATDKDKAYNVGTYTLQSASQQGSLGGSFIYNDFAVKLNTIQRAPSSEDDMLVASFTVTNRSTAAEQVPALGGYFMVNGVKIGTEQKAIALDDSVTIGPGASADFVVYSEIPYTTAIDKITFVSTETVQDKAGKQLYQFNAQSLSAIPFKKQEDSYLIKSIGKRSTVNVLRTAVFNGTTKNNFYAEFEAVNNEMRSAAIAPLGGYIVDKKGIVIPVQFATVKDKLSPSGKALLSAYAEIPKSFDTSSYNLILGQSIVSSNSGTGGTGTSGSGSGTGDTDTPAANPVLVNMVSYPLSASAPVTSSDLGKIQFAGYTLGLHYINAFLSVAGQYDVNGLKMTLDYNLAKNNDYEVITGDHKLLVEFVNQDNNHLTYSKQFSLLTGAANDEVLVETEDSPLTIAFDNDTAIQSKILHYDTYKVNVYDVFQNSKLLLASKEMNWFTTTP